jgi:hypothetical protein
MKKVYKNFYDFVTDCSSKELEYFIFDSTFTTSFNKGIGEVIKGIENQDKKNIEVAIIFNTEGEIALIDSYIIGKYIGNNYGICMEQYYKESSLNKIVRCVVNGNEKNKKDFLILSFDILYNTLESIYYSIKCKKDTVNKYENLYDLKKYKGNDESVSVAAILILEDICKYMRIEEKIMIEAIEFHLNKKDSQDT